MKKVIRSYKQLNCKWKHRMKCLCNQIVKTVYFKERYNNLKIITDEIYMYVKSKLVEGK